MSIRAITKNTHPNIDLDKSCLYEESEVCVGGTNELGFGKKGVSLVDVEVCRALSVKVIPVVSTAIVNQELKVRMKGRLQGQRHETSAKLRPARSSHSFFIHSESGQKYFWV